MKNSTFITSNGKVKDQYAIPPIPPATRTFHDAMFPVFFSTSDLNFDLASS